jgi:chromosome segregation ATPase
MNKCNDPDHDAINAERSESRGLRKAWIELDDKRQELERELAGVTEQRDEAINERDKMQTELDMWRDGNIMHEVHRNELEKVEQERDEAHVTIEDAKRALNATDYEGILLAAMRVKDERDKATKQRDRLAEVLRVATAYPLSESWYKQAMEALATLKPCD